MKEHGIVLLKHFEKLRDDLWVALCLFSEELKGGVGDQVLDLLHLFVGHLNLLLFAVASDSNLWDALVSLH